jgi:hypothetical protein
MSELGEIAANLTSLAKSRINNDDFSPTAVNSAVFRPSASRIYPSSARTILPEHSNSNGVKKILLTQMIRAKRAGTWFGLGRAQRGLYGLAMRLDVKLQSPELLKALVSVLKSLRQTCDRAGVAFIRAMRLAWAISEAAVRWGNPEARHWRNDQEFIRFLAITSGGKW